MVADTSDEVVKRGMERIEDSLSKLVASYERSKGSAHGLCTDTTWPSCAALQTSRNSWIAI